MRFVFTTVNGLYSNGSLAVHQLAAYAEDHVRHSFALPSDGRESVQLLVREYKQTQLADEISRDLFSCRADIYLFITDSRNKRVIDEVAEVLGQANPACLIGYCGSEVSYDPEDQLTNWPQVDFIITGEAEEAVIHLIDVRNTRLWQQLRVSRASELLPSVIHELQNTVCRHPAGGFLYGAKAKAVDVGKMVFAYEDMKKEKMPDPLFYESVRIPEKEKDYPLQRVGREARQKSVETVCLEIGKLEEAGVEQVIFTDPVFNSDSTRADRIWRYLISEKEQDPENQDETEATLKKTRYYFNVDVNLLSDQMIQSLSAPTAARLHFDVSILSTNTERMKQYGAGGSFSGISSKIVRLQEDTAVSIHISLVTAMPDVSVKEHQQSFNDLLSLRPDTFRLRFLNFPKGSDIRRRAERGEALFLTQAPYGIISTAEQNFDDLSLWKDTAILLDKLYNSGNFQKSVLRLSAMHTDAFQAFNHFIQFLNSSRRQIGLLSVHELVESLYRYAETEAFEVGEREGLHKRLKEEYLETSFGSEKNWNKIK